MISPKQISDFSDLSNRTAEAIIPLLVESYKWGYRDGLCVAEKIHGWITGKNQSKKMVEVEQWAREAIRKAKEKLNE